MAGGVIFYALGQKRSRNFAKPLDKLKNSGKMIIRKGQKVNRLRSEKAENLAGNNKIVVVCSCCERKEGFIYGIIGESD